MSPAASVPAAGTNVPGSGGDGGGTTTTNPLTITTTALPSGNVGTSYTAFITSSGGFGTPHEFKVIAGRLPDGLSMQSAFGVQSTAITGTPVTVQVGTFTIEVRDQTGNTATRTLSIPIASPPPLIITNQSSTLAPGTVGSSYAAQLFADGGLRPYRWSVAAGSLPPGVALDTSGRLSGTPALAGTFTFTALVGDKVGAQASHDFSIAVGSASTT